MEEKFLAEIQGPTYGFTLQGSGDMADAKAALEGVFEGHDVSVRAFGDAPDMSGQ